ncbi:hypothetical protein BLA39750_01058 [Burkholderia lata]|uniref:Transmembrane protein n=1 Tax=Burkholderia lata (strain ATCC 17760 / DSM 23089 / LMG 22485 / NCIMB 9086 / R18194 / 383) TaxID=482957 RepID=A0A6P2UV07_BURL3|nr:hypothetical protein [Burkholderia lata]VWC78993.1 hypothetical protein BLA39750_01058 [Burkholderia lata]
MIDDFWHAGLAGIICGLAMYLATYFSIGARARLYPAGAIVTALLFSPWWAALIAGIVGHLASVLVVARALNKPVSSKWKIGFSGAGIVAVIASMSWINHLGEIATSAIEQSDSENWRKIADSGTAGSFVVDHYRPCMIPRVSYINAYRTTVTHIDRQDATVCANAVVSRARETGGDHFAQDVSRVIDGLPSSLALTSAARATLDKLING